MGNCFARRNRVKKVRQSFKAVPLHSRVVEDDAPSMPILKANIVEIHEPKQRRTTPKIEGQFITVEVDVHRSQDSSVTANMVDRDPKAAGDHIIDEPETVATTKADTGLQQDKMASSTVVDLLFSKNIGALFKTLDGVFDRNMVGNSMIGLYGGNSKGMVIDLDDQLLNELDNLPVAKRV